MGKKTISLNLDDIGEDNTLVSSILNNIPSDIPSNNYDKVGNKVGNKGNSTKGKTQSKSSNKKSISLDLGNDLKSELSLSDIKIEKPNKNKKRKIPNNTLDFNNSKMDKVAKLDDFLTISKDETANSLTHPKTKDYQIGRQEAEIKLESIQSQIGKINNKIAKKGRNNVDKRYIDSLNKLLKKEDKYIAILNSYSQDKNKLPILDGKNSKSYNSYSSKNHNSTVQLTREKGGQKYKKNNIHTTPKTSNLISEIDSELERVDQLLNLTEGKGKKYQDNGYKKKIKDDRLKLEVGQNNNISKSNNVINNLKNVNLGMDLDGVHYIPNMDINQLRNTKNNKKGNNVSNIKKEMTPPKTMFSVKANLLALKEREKMLAKQKRKIQEKLEFKKKQILKAKQQEKEMKKIKALEMEKRRLFELDREVKRLDKLRFQQNKEMKNTMKQMTQRQIAEQINLDNIQKEEFIHTKHKQYQPFTYNFNTNKTVNQMNTQMNTQMNKSRSQSPTLFTKIHNNLMNMGIGEKVIFKSKNKSQRDNKLLESKNNNIVTPKVSKKGFKYIKKDYIDSNINWIEWQDTHLKYFNNNSNSKDSNNNNLSINVFPYTLYYPYLKKYCLCKNDNFSDKLIKNKYHNEQENKLGKTITTLLKRNIYDKSPLDIRKTELCGYLGIINKSNMDDILNIGIQKVLPINKENNKLLLMKIWYGCFEEGKIFLSNASNKIFSQKRETVEQPNYLSTTNNY